MYRSEVQERLSVDAEFLDYLYEKSKSYGRIRHFYGFSFSSEIRSGKNQEQCWSVKHFLEKPKIANVDQVVLVTTVKDPDIPPRMIDRFLVLAEKSHLDVVIVFNKIDLLDSEDLKKLDRLIEIYSRYYDVLKTSAKRGDGLNELMEFLKGKVSTMAGVSGVGKSSLLNAISPGIKLRTGELSRKLKRGKHTTTHTELLRFSFGGYVADTPGFANLDISSIKPEELKEYFPEFKEVGPCEFSDCVHIDEPGCAVKEAVGDFIPESRYESYKDFYMEIISMNGKLR